MDFEYQNYPKKINIGCGYDLKTGYLNIDLNEYHQPDLVADCTQLKCLPSAYYEYILANDILEHIPRLKTSTTLREWNRLLAHGGMLELQIPNVIGLLSLLKKPENQTLAKHEELLRCLFGTQCYNGDFHFIGFTEITIKNALYEAGFTIKSLNSVDDWLFNVKAVKTGEPLYDGLIDIQEDDDFLFAAFMHLLKRKPDSGGFDHYKAQLSKGMEREAIVENIKGSQEYIQLNKTTQTQI